VSIDADIIGLSELDAISGEHGQVLMDLLQIMKGLGYAH